MSAPYTPRYSVCEPTGAIPPMRVISDSPSLEGAQADLARALPEHPSALIIDWFLYEEPLELHVGENGPGAYHPAMTDTPLFDLGDVS